MYVTAAGRTRRWKRRHPIRRPGHRELVRPCRRLFVATSRFDFRAAKPDGTVKAALLDKPAVAHGVAKQVDRPRVADRVAGPIALPTQAGFGQDVPASVSASDAPMVNAHYPGVSPPQGMLHH